MLRGRLVAATLLTLALSCGEGAVEPVRSGSLCAALTEAMCLGNLDCCDEPTRVAPDMETCLAENLDLCERVLGGEAEDPAVGYDPIAAGLLLAAVEDSARACGEVPELGLDALYRRRRDAPATGLAVVLPGTLEGGADCGGEESSDLACREGLVCQRPRYDGASLGGAGGLAGLGGLSVLAGPGTCGPPPEPPALGDRCRTLGGQGCAGDAVCASCARFPDTPGCPEEPGLAEGRCAATGDLGGPCGPLTCGEGLYCEGAWGPDLGACVPVKPEGSECESGRECAAGSCEAGACGPTPPERSHCPVWRGRIG